MTAGITAYFSYTILTFGIARANGVSELQGGAGALVAFGAYVVTIVATLAVNDWLTGRYPAGRADQAPPRDHADV